MLFWHERVLPGSFQHDTDIEFSFLCGAIDVTLLRFLRPYRGCCGGFESVHVTSLIARNFVVSLSRNKKVWSGACTASMEVFVHLDELTPRLLLAVLLSRPCLESVVTICLVP